MIDFYFNLKGRISRRDYWVKFFVIFNIGTLVALLILSALLEITNEFFLLNFALTLLFIFALFAFSWVIFAVTLRRLHDRGWQGWSLLICLVPILSFWPLFEAYFLPGKPGPNRHGENPLDLKSLSVM